MNTDSANGINRTVKTVGGLLAIVVVVVSIVAGLVADRSNVFRSIEINDQRLGGLEARLAGYELRLRSIEQATRGIETDVAWMRSSMEKRTP